MNDYTKQHSSPQPEELRRNKGHSGLGKEGCDILGQTSGENSSVRGVANMVGQCTTETPKPLPRKLSEDKLRPLNQALPPPPPYKPHSGRQQPDTFNFHEWYSPLPKTSSSPSHSKSTSVHSQLSPAEPPAYSQDLSHNMHHHPLQQPPQLYSDPISSVPAEKMTIHTGKWTTVGNPLSLMEVASLPQTSLPKYFTTSKEDPTFPVIRRDQILHVKFKKIIEVVEGTSSKGSKLIFPRNLKMKLSPVFTENRQQYTLSAPDLCRSMNLPSVVKVTKEFTHRKKGVTITQNTLLFLTDEEKAKNPSKGRLSVKATDLRGMTVAITPSCKGVFSVNPDEIKLYLPEIITYCQFPCNILLENGIYSSDVITLQKVYMQEVLVAQPFNLVSREPEDRYVEIPTNKSMWLTEMHVSDPKTTNPKPHQLNQNKYAHNVAPETPRSNQFPPVTNRGAQILKLSKIRQTSEPDLSSSLPSNEDTEPVDYDYVHNWSRVCLGIDYEAMTVPKKAKERSNSLPVVLTAKDNISYLRNLSTVDIMQLLDAMKLGEYKDAFKREMIDGEIMCALSEEMLLNDLKIEKQLHRLRLMKLISGQTSSRKFLDGTQDTTT